MSGSLGVVQSGLDPSISLQAGKGVTAPTGFAADPNTYLNTLSTLNKLRMFPGEQQLQQQAIQTGQQGIQSRAISLAEQRRAAANGYLVSLLGNPDPKLQDVVRAQALGVNDQLPMDAAIADTAQTFPVGGTPEERRAWVSARVSQSGLTPAERLGANVPHAGPMVDTGQQILPTTVGAPLGVTPGVTNVVGRPVETYPSRSGLISQVTWKDQNGAEHYGTAAQYAAERGLNPLLGPAVPVTQGVTTPARAAPTGAMQPPALPAPGTLGPGAYVPRQQAAAAPGAPPVASPTAPTMTDTAGPAPGVVAVQQADAKAFKDDQLALPALRTTDQNMMHAYDALKLTTSGPSADATHKLYGFLQTNGLLPAGMTDDLKNYEEFRKYTERYIADAGDRSGTDAGRALAAESNAGHSISKPANLEIIRNDIGKNRQAIAANMSAPDQTTGVGYGAHRAKHANNTDYRGFVWDLYSPQEQANILKQNKPGSVGDLALHRAIGMAHTFNLDSGQPAGG